jgi:hypothetical protein
VVQAVAGSSPVAHPHEAPANAGVLLCIAEVPPPRPSTKRPPFSSTGSPGDEGFAELVELAEHSGSSGLVALDLITDLSGLLVAGEG